MSLSCTVATTRDDESLRPRVIPVLHNTLGLRAKPVLLIFSHRQALRHRIKSKSSVSLHEHFRLSLTLERTIPGSGTTNDMHVFSEQGKVYQPT